MAKSSFWKMIERRPFGADRRSATDRQAAKPGKVIEGARDAYQRPR
jgi:hypothetical protein